jgi:hypothetical protein
VRIETCTDEIRTREIAREGHGARQSSQSEQYPARVQGDRRGGLYHDPEEAEGRVRHLACQYTGRKGHRTFERGTYESREERAIAQGVAPRHDVHVPGDTFVAVGSAFPTPSRVFCELAREIDRHLHGSKCQGELNENGERTHECIQVYLCWVKMRVNALKRLSSKAAFPSYAEVKALLDLVEAKDAEAMKKIEALRQTMSKPVKPQDEVDISVWGSVLGAVDKKASLLFSGVSEHLGEMSGPYITPLSTYRQTIMKTLRDAWGLTANEDFAENEILNHYDRIVARVLLYLTPQEGKEVAPLPLLGGFVMNAAWDSFVNIQDGIGEVSVSF